MLDDWLRREVLPAQLLEAAPDAMIVTDEGGAIVYVNGEAEELFGYRREELLRQPVEVLLPEGRRGGHAAHRRSFSEDPRARPMGKGLDIIGRRKDGSEFPADIKLSPLNMPTGLLTTAAIRDITPQKEAAARLLTYAAHLEALQATLTRKNIELERQNRELEQLAYVSSHDLQEPLRKIVAFGDRLRERCDGALDDRGRDYLTRMQSAARRMQLLINDLLELSRLSTRGRPFERVDLRQVAEAAVAELELAAERAGGEVELGELGVIDADPAQMRQLLVNLVGNALKFHREGEPPRVRVWGRRAGPGEPIPPGVTAPAAQRGLYEIHVEDDGIGIEPRFAERIFTVFERLNPREKYEGTGIGLAICKKIAERHGGAITVRSQLGQGSAFVVTLPEAQDEEGDAAAAGAEAARS